MPDHTKTMMKYHRTSRSFALATLLTVSALAVRAQDAAYQKIPDGIQVKVGEAQVDLVAVAPAAFRISVAYGGSAVPAPSAFLAPSGKRVNWQLDQSGDSVGVKTSAGELSINPATGQWTLKSGSGQTLIPAGKIASGSGASQVAIDVGWDPGRTPAFYGSGNGMGQKLGTDVPDIIGPETLQQSEAHSHLANGVAVIPYYWSSAGYSVLGVTSDDNKPASWDSKPDQACVTWTFPGATADLYLMPTANLREAATANANLTGFPPVPPRWTFGFMQSRWGWKDRAYIEDTMHQYLSRHLPIDAFIFDVEWYTPVIDYSIPDSGSPTFKDFSWNPKLFPDPAAQIAAYRADDLYSVFIRKPRLGNEELLKMMHEKHWDLPNWQSIHGGLVPRVLNYRDPAVRDWYAQQIEPLLKCGVDGWWNDEGEATFTTFFYWIMSEQEAQDACKPGMRLWTLNRSFSPGLQRLGGAAWTGDVQALWPQVGRTATDLLNWSLAGLPYETCDIGGFRGEPSPELFTRWMQSGVFYPIMRAHSTQLAQPHFPWLFGADAEQAMRSALDLRYRLIPYYYSLAYEAHETGVPLMRPMLMEYPQDANVADMSDQWFMGDGLLAAPILTETNERAVYLPADDWYVFNTNQRQAGNRTITATAGLSDIPLYVRAGTILPLGQVIEHTLQMPGGPLEVQIYPGRNATFTLVEDDGVTTAYLKGKNRRTTFTWNDTARRLSWKTEGHYDGKDIYTQLKVVVFDPQGVRQTGKTLTSHGSVTP